MDHRGADLLHRTIGYRHERKPHMRIAEPEQARRVFDGRRARLDEKRRMERHESILDREGGLEVSSERRLLELRTESWRHVRRNGNAADPAMRVEGKRRSILAGELDEVG